MTDKKVHTHKNNGNFSIQNQVGNLFSLNLFLWRHFSVSSDHLLRIVGWFASSISYYKNSNHDIITIYNYLKI